MSGQPRKPRQAPDGAPKPAPPDRDATNRSRVGEVQDPMISGDAGAPASRNSNEPRVDEAGQIEERPAPPDLLH